MRTAIVVDDHPFIRAAVKLILEQEHFEVIAEADNGADAIQLARELVPDFILIDIAMPKIDGLEALNRISALRLPISMLVLTSQSAEFFSTRCMKAGAAGYVCKGDDLSELVKAIRAVKSGYSFFPKLTSHSVRRDDVDVSEYELLMSLSDRETTVLQQLASGQSNKQIASNMLLSNKTISTYKTRIIEKLNINSLVKLADFAKRNGLI